MAGAIDRVPTNLNQLSPLGFKFHIKKLPHVNFFLQEVAIPSITLPAVSIGTPFVDVPVPGDRMRYPELGISFKVDENLQNYQEIFRWIRDVSFDKNFDQYARLTTAPRWTGDGIYSDVSVFVLSSHSNPTHEIVFRDAFPTSLSSLQFAANAPDVEYLTCQATFAYTLFDFNTDL
jgi:hypothetical protein